MLRSLPIIAVLVITTVSHAAAPVRDFRVEYRKNGGGLYTAFLRNRHASAVTSYIAEASFFDGPRERHSAMGGDTLGFTSGEEAEIPASQETDAGRPLPRGATPSAARVLAVIYADGFTEGEDEVLAMLLSGRHRAYADLKECVPAIEKASRGEIKPESLIALFNAMQMRDQSEGASLDNIVDAPGRMRYRYFMSAVPTQALQILNSGGSVDDLLEHCRAWRTRLADSKPDVK